MKSVKRIARMTALAVAVCMLLTMSVFATETGRFWAAESSAEGEAVAAVMGTGVVTDGVVEMTYDADALSPEDLQVNEKYVAMYSVNAEEEGVLLIAWVAPGEIEIDGEDWLFKLSADETEEDPTEEPTEGEDPTEAPADEDEEPTEKPTEGATKPEGNKKPGSTGGNGSTGTGDNNRLVMMVVLAVACVAGIAAAAYVMLKGKKEGKA